MPSGDLLEMQWDLLRVAALGGAADVTDDYYHSKDPDERGFSKAVNAHEVVLHVDVSVVGVSLCSLDGLAVASYTGWLPV
jgi:hypothetical protein